MLASAARIAKKSFAVKDGPMTGVELEEGDKAGLSLYPAADGRN